MLKLLPLLLALFSGCAFFIEKIDTALVDEKDYLKNVPKKPTFCGPQEKSSFQLVGTDEHSENAYLEMTQRLGQERKLDFFDHFALWSLTQLAIRPDQSSPTSRFQVLFHYKNKTHYYDFFSESPTDQYPYFYGIEWILRKFGKTTSLETYVNVLEASLTKNLKVGPELEKFLTKNQELIKANAELSPFFFRGTEVLKENESTPHLSYSTLLRFYRKVEKAQKIMTNTSLTPFTAADGSTGRCNYDYNLYDNSIFLIDKIIPITNMFGLALPDMAFMASSSQVINGVSALHGQPVFKGESKVRSSAVCTIDSDSKKIWTISNQSRDPGQHLFHLIRYGLAKTQTVAGVDKLLRHSRHLFLSDPVRLVIESQRSRSDQIENLLKLNLPIYNAEKLGNVWSYTSFKDQNRFILDDRNPGAYLCK